MPTHPTILCSVESQRLTKDCPHLLNSFRNDYFSLCLPLDFESARNMGCALVHSRDADARKHYEERDDSEVTQFVPVSFLPTPDSSQSQRLCFDSSEVQSRVTVSSLGSPTLG